MPKVALSAQYTEQRLAYIELGKNLLSMTYDNSGDDMHSAQSYLVLDDVGDQLRAITTKEIDYLLKDSKWMESAWLGLVGKSTAGKVDSGRGVFLSVEGRNYMNRHYDIVDPGRNIYKRYKHKSVKLITGSELSLLISYLLLDYKDLMGMLKAMRMKEHTEKYARKKPRPGQEVPKYTGLSDETLVDGLITGIPGVLDGAPLLVLGQTPLERFKVGDGQQYVSGKLYRWLTFVSSSEFQAPDPCVANSIKFWAGWAILEALVGLATVHDARVSWSEFVEQAIVRMTDGVSPCACPIPMFNFPHRLQDCSYLSGKTEGKHTGTPIVIHTDAPGLYPVPDYVEVAEAAKIGSLSDHDALQQLRSVDKAKAGAKVLAEHSTATQKLRPKKIATTVPNLDILKRHIDSLPNLPGETEESVHWRKAREYLELTQRAWDDVTPVVESADGVRMTQSTRTNMTFSRMHYCLGLIHSLIMYADSISKIDVEDFNVQRFYAEMFFSCYFSGGNGIKGIKGKVNDFMQLMPTERYVAIQGGSLASSGDHYQGGSPYAISRNGGFSISYTHGSLECAQTPLNISKVIPHTSFYTRGYDKEDVITKRVKALVDAKLPYLASCTHLLTLSSRDIKAILYEPMATLGYTYSSHLIPMLQVPQVEDRPGVDMNDPVWSSVDHVLKLVNDYTSESKLKTIEDATRAMMTSMTTSKSSGQFKTKFNIGGRSTRALGHRGRGGDMENSRGVEFSTSGKALTDAYLGMWLMTGLFLFAMGTWLYRFITGRRDVAAGRMARNMYITPTSLQIPLQFYEQGLKTFLTSRLVYERMDISKENYVIVRSDTTELQKGAACYFMSSLCSQREKSVCVCLDYSTMDQNLVPVINRHITLGRNYRSGPTVRALRTLVDNPTDADYVTVDENGFIAPPGEGTLPTIVQFATLGWHAATTGVFESKSATPTDVKGLGVITLTGLGNGLCNQRVKGPAVPPMVLLKDVNTSGNRLTGSFNSKYNSYILEKNFGAWGDDAYKWYDWDEFLADFPELQRRARATGQAIEREGCQIGCDITFLKVNYEGLQSYRRQRSINSESAEGKGGGLNPFTAMSTLVSMYEAGVRSGSATSFITFMKFVVKHGDSFSGFGYKSAAFDGWFTFGGRFPCVVGELPISPSKHVKSHYSYYLLSWFRNLGYTGSGRTTPLVLRVPVGGAQDLKADTMAKYLLGVIDDAQLPEDLRYGITDDVTVTIKGLKSSESSERLIKSAQRERAMESFQIGLEKDKIANSAAMCETWLARSNISNADAELITTLRYQNRFSRQASRVLSDELSFSSGPKAIAEAMAEGIHKNQIETEEFRISTVAPNKDYYSWPPHKITTLRVSEATWRVCGRVTFQFLTPQQDDLRVTYEMNDRLGLSASAKPAPAISYVSLDLFDRSKGMLERFICSFFGHTTDSKYKDRLFVPSQPDVTLTMLTRLFNAMDGEVAAVAALLGVEADTLKFFDMHMDMKKRLDLMDLLDDGSMRLSGALGTVGYDMIRSLGLIHAPASPYGTDAYEALCEYTLSYTVTLWVMMWNALKPDIYSKKRSVTFPIMRLTFVDTI